MILVICLYLSIAMAVVPFRFWDKPYEVFIGCEKYINSIATFSDNQESWCGNKNALYTMVECLVGGSLGFEQAEEVFQDRCSSEYFDETLMKKAYHIFTNESVPDSEIEQVAQNPIFLDKSKVFESMEASIRLYEMKDKSMYFGILLNCYWLVVFLAASIVNWSMILFPRLRTRAIGITFSWIRRFFTLPALGKFHKKQSKELLGIVNLYSPSRMESSIITGFVLLSLILCSVGYDAPNNTSSFQPTIKDYVHYVANRSAIVSTSLLPLVILLSGRNNILQWCTQWDYSTFMLYHRWIGRVSIIGIIVHSIVVSVSLELHDAYREVMESWSIIWGTVGTVAGSLLFFGGFLYFRRNFYETFFALHLFLGIIFLVGSWLHLASLGYSFLMTISITLFLMDRSLRYMRLIYFGFPEAKITFFADNTLRVEIPRPRYYFSVPGGHGWLTFGRYFWQSHPFSCIESPTKTGTIIFLCAVKSGVTKRIANKIRATGNQSLNMKVAMEGIYGKSAPTRAHSSVVFIAGGKGFPGIFSEAYAKAQNPSDLSKHMKFLWILKDQGSLECCAEELSALANTRIQTTVYFTRYKEQVQLPGKQSENFQKVEYDKGDNLLEAFPHITFLYYRPEIADIISEETEQCEGSVAFVSCGHPAMVDAMRVAVVEILSQTTKRVDYFDQLQGWA